MVKVLTESEAYVISVLYDYAINKNINASETIDLNKVDIVELAEHYQIPQDHCAILLSELKHKDFIFNHHIQLSTKDNPIFVKKDSAIIHYNDMEHFTLKPLENVLISHYVFQDNEDIKPTILNKEYGIAFAKNIF